MWRAESSRAYRKQQDPKRTHFQPFIRLTNKCKSNTTLSLASPHLHQHLHAVVCGVRVLLLPRQWHCSPVVCHTRSFVNEESRHELTANDSRSGIDQGAFPPQPCHMPPVLFESVCFCAKRGLINKFLIVEGDRSSRFVQFFQN